jgi:ATP/maltotriose-dependent transcriptional regulator MalT
MTAKHHSPALIRTKLYRPPLPSDRAPRSRLLERLRQERRRPLTLVSAPAGFGKSTLFSAWLGGCDWPSAWLSLDDYHVIHTPAIHDLLMEVLHHPPRALHLILATRHDPPPLIDSRRARGGVRSPITQFAFLAGRNTGVSAPGTRSAHRREPGRRDQGED